MRLAAQGLRNMDDGDAQVTDSAERAALLRQARKVYIESIVSVVVLTAIFYFV